MKNNLDIIHGAPRLTKVQRFVLGELISNGGRIITSPGHKSTSIVHTKVGRLPVLKCSWVVILPLKSRGLIETEKRDEGGIWVSITTKGHDAVRQNITP